MESNFFILSIVSLSLCSSVLMSDNSLEEKSFQNGKDMYNQTCVSCHGKNGETNPDIHLVVKPRKLNKTILTQEQSFKIIKEGAHHWGARSDIMPSFKYVFDDKEIEDISYYIFKAFNSSREQRISKLLLESGTVSKGNKAKMLKTGKKIFKRNCSMCHGATGNGESVYVEQSKAAKNFIFPYNLTRTLLDENQIFLYAKFGGHYWGTDKDDMPSWKKKYNDFELKSVSKYISEKIKKIK